MPEDSQKLQEVVEETTTDEGEQQEELQASEKPAEELELEGEVKDRTKEQFEKLKLANQELKRELEQAKRPTQSVLGSMVPNFNPADVKLENFAPQVQLQNLSEQKIEEIKQELVDADGYVNTQVLNQKLKFAEEAERRAKEAERKAQQAMDRVANYEINQQVKDLHSEFPELDPNSTSFNPDAYTLVQNELLNQLVQTGNQDGLGAARKMSRYFRPQESKQQDVKQRAIEEQKKAIISVANSGKAQRTVSNEEYEDLKKRSLTDKDAMSERLRLAGY
jgi:hypothetical protein